MTQTVDAKSNKKGPKFKSASENLNRIKLYNCYIKYEISKLTKLNVVLFNVLPGWNYVTAYDLFLVIITKLKLLFGKARIVLE